MLVQKSTGLAVPILFKTAVDHLTAAAVFSSQADAAGVSAALAAGAMAIVTSGAFKAISGVATELRSVAFTPVAQAAGRRVALQVFNHVLNLDLSFHLNRRTGALQRIIDRGTRSVTMVFRAVVFTFAPTALELTLVCALLWKAFSWHVVAIVLATFVAYVAWTRRADPGYKRGPAQNRQRDGRGDHRQSGGPALLNYETVSVFGNVRMESKQYDGLLRAYHEAALGSGRCLERAQRGVSRDSRLRHDLFLYTPRSEWDGGGLAAVGPALAGDLVMANGLLLQLWAPLQFLGFFYRELRQSLVDMEAMFEVMSTVSAVKDGDRELPTVGGKFGENIRGGRDVKRVFGPEVHVQGARVFARRALRIRREPRGFEGRHAGHRARSVRGHRRAERVGQKHVVASAFARVRRGLRAPFDRRRGRARREARVAARGHGDRPAGHRAVQRHAQAQLAVRARGRDGGGGARSRVGGATGPDARADAGGAGHDGRRTRREAVGWGKAARGHRARVPARAEGFCSRTRPPPALDTATEIGILQSLQEVAQGRTAVFVGKTHAIDEALVRPRRGDGERECGAGHARRVDDGARERREERRVRGDVGEPAGGDRERAGARRGEAEESRVFVTRAVRGACTLKVRI